MLNLKQYGIKAPITDPAKFVPEAITAYNALVENFDAGSKQVSAGEKAALAAFYSDEEIMAEVEPILTALRGTSDLSFEGQAVILNELRLNFVTPLENAAEFAVWSYTEENEQDATNDSEDAAATFKLIRDAIDKAYAFCQMIGGDAALIAETKKAIKHNEKEKDDGKHVRPLLKEKDGKYVPNLRNTPRGLESDGKTGGRKAEVFYYAWNVDGEEVPAGTTEAELRARYLPTVSHAEFTKAWKAADRGVGKNVSLKFGDVVVLAIHKDNQTAEKAAE